MGARRRRRLAARRMQLLGALSKAPLMMLFMPRTPMISSSVSWCRQQRKTCGGYGLPMCSGAWLNGDNAGGGHRRSILGMMKRYPVPPYRRRDVGAYKEMVTMLAKCDGVRPLTGPVAVTVALYRERKSGRLSDRLMCLLDAMQGVFSRMPLRYVSYTLHYMKIVMILGLRWRYNRPG